MRWLHTGGIYAALSEQAAATLAEAEPGVADRPVASPLGDAPTTPPAKRSRRSARPAAAPDTPA